MSIRITDIAIKGGGPLAEDFHLRPGDLNLVYGPNESGKTYLVEAMIRLLFKTGARTGLDWGLREWDLSGKITVSGLSDEAVRFTKTGRKLDDCWAEDRGLPRDLSRLLVVKAGRTALSADAGDGVGRDVLRNCLSGVGILDRIENRISKTLRKAAVAEPGVIDGDNKGEIKARNKARKALDKVERLLEDVEAGYDSGEVYRLRKQKEALEEQVARLEQARRYRAFALREQMRALEDKIAALPPEEEVNGLEREITLYRSKNSEREENDAALAALAGVEGDCRWAEQAAARYRALSGTDTPGRQSSYCLWAALSCLAAAGITAAIGRGIISLAAAAAAGVLVLLYRRLVTAQLATRGDREECARLRDDYRGRFGEQLADGAVLDARVEALKEQRYRLTDRRERREQLTAELGEMEADISRRVAALAHTEPAPERWTAAITERREARRTLTAEHRRIEKDLAAIGGAPDGERGEDPGIAWDRETHDRARGRLDETDRELAERLDGLEELKTRIGQETGSRSREWEDLVEELRKRRDEAAAAYRDITAEILAKVQVHRALAGLRDEENARIDDGLRREELAGPLRLLTGRYESVFRKDEGLVLLGDDGEYPLESLSTGAAEQVLLALRTGMASVAMGGQRAFLLLDDAFQHSDWRRRPHLVDYCVTLARAGWQVFYFTMDDHLRDLLRAAGKKCGEGFTNSEL